RLVAAAPGVARRWRRPLRCRAPEARLRAVPYRRHAGRDRDGARSRRRCWLLGAGRLRGAGRRPLLLGLDAVAWARGVALGRDLRGDLPADRRRSGTAVVLAVALRA